MFVQDKIRKRPRYLTTISILLAIFGFSYLSEGNYNLFLLDYVSQIILYANATAHIFFAVGLRKWKKWGRKGTIILLILNLVFTLMSFGQTSSIDSILKIVTYGIILFYLFKFKEKEYFREFGKRDSLSLHAVPIFNTYKSQLGSIRIPKGIKYFRKIFLSISIWYLIAFIAQISIFTIQVSEDSQINPDTRRTKNLDFNKTTEYYSYLFQYLAVFAFSLSWMIVYLSMRMNKPWSRTIILILCTIYIGDGKYVLLSYSNDSTGILGPFTVIQTGLAIILLFYFNKLKVEEYYHDIKYAK